MADSSTMPKLDDDGDNEDEAPNNRSLFISDDDCDSDEDLFTKLCPRDYEESGDLVEFCELALAYYQAQHPGESYKFERGLGGNWYFNIASEYNIEFCAKKAHDYSIQNFKAQALYHSHRGPEELIVNECFRVKNARKVLPEIKRATQYVSSKILSLEGLEEKEVAKLFEYCKSAVTFYNGKTGESYEVVGIEQVERWVLRGYEYILTFHARRNAVSVPDTFKAYVNYLARAVGIKYCELSSNTELD